MAQPSAHAHPFTFSPFVGRLADTGQNGMDLVRNIKRMFAQSDGHVLLLAASIRTLEHLLYCFALDVDLLTAPAKIRQCLISRRDAYQKLTLRSVPL